MADTGKTIALIKALAGNGGSGEGGGSGGGAFIVHDVNGTLDKTYAEIAEAAQTSVVIYAHESDDDVMIFEYLDGIGQYFGSYMVAFGGGGRSTAFAASSENDYPASMKDNNNGPVA